MADITIPVTALSILSAAIIGAAATLGIAFFKWIQGRFDRAEDKAEQHFNAERDHVDKRFDRMETRFTEGFDRINQRIDRVFPSYNPPPTTTVSADEPLQLVRKPE